MTHLTVTLTEAVVDILTPRRRASNHLGFTIRGKALTTTIPSLLATTKTRGTAVLALACGDRANHSWVEPTNRTTFGDGNYVHDSHAQDVHEDVVVAIVTDGYGARSADGVIRTIRIEVPHDVAEALSYVSSQTSQLTVWVDGTTLTITTTIEDQ